MALINSAVNLAKVTHHGVEEQSENEAERMAKASQAVTQGYVRKTKSI